MSNEFLKAADDARVLLRGFNAVATLANAFEKAGSIVQAMEEAEKALPALQADTESAKAELKQAKADTQKAKDDAKKVTAEAKQVADGIVSAASVKADSIKAAADNYYETTVQASKQTEADAALRAQAGSPS
jgi:chromosome segregation ATPase